MDTYKERQKSEQMGNENNEIERQEVDLPVIKHGGQYPR